MGGSGGARLAGVLACIGVVWHRQMQGAEGQLQPVSPFANGSGCPGGKGLGLGGGGSCEACPVGKQSPAGEVMCSYCRETLQPAAAQDGCECAPLHFSPWNATVEQPDVGCTPCAALHVHRLAQTQRGLFEVFVHGSADSSAVPCAGPSAGVKELLPDQGDTDAVNNLCSTYDHTECAGGPKGDAAVCPNAGVWILPRPFERIRQNVSAFPPGRTSEQVDLFTLQECLTPRGGGASRCQHWSRCVKDADAGSESGDPWTPYVSDKEFAAWLAKDNSAKNCRTVLGDLPSAEDTNGKAARLEDFDDPWARVLSDGFNCCAPNYRGELCDTCIEPLMKIKEQCVRCESDINWSKMILGVIMAAGFTLFIIHKATVNFSDADGTITIAIFFFQLIALLFKDRASRMAWPIMLDLLSVMELSFLANSERTCVIKLDFYPNYYFSILSTISVVLGTYAVLIAIMVLTSTVTGFHKQERMPPAQAKNLKAAVHVLGHVHVFESLEPQYRENIAAAMVRRVAMLASIDGLCGMAEFDFLSGCVAGVERQAEARCSTYG